MWVFSTFPSSLFVPIPHAKQQIFAVLICMNSRSDAAEVTDESKLLHRSLWSADIALAHIQMTLAQYLNSFISNMKHFWHLGLFEESLTKVLLPDFSDLQDETFRLILSWSALLLCQNPIFSSWQCCVFFPLNCIFQKVIIYTFPQLLIHNYVQSTRGGGN